MTSADHSSTQLMVMSANLGMTGSLDSWRSGIRFELQFKENSLNEWKMLIKFYRDKCINVNA